MSASMPATVSAKPVGSDINGSTGNFNTNAFLIGGTLGANYQTGPYIVGFEGDIDWTNLSGTSSSAGCINLSAGLLPAGSTCTTKQDCLGTARVRIGYAFDRVFVFGTAGAAFGNERAIVNTPGLGSVTNAFPAQLGWTVGGGVEYAFRPAGPKVSSDPRWPRNRSVEHGDNDFNHLAVAHQSDARPTGEISQVRGGLENVQSSSSGCMSAFNASHLALSAPNGRASSDVFRPSRACPDARPRPRDADLFDEPGCRDDQRCLPGRFVRRIGRLTLPEQHCAHQGNNKSHCVQG